ncbi:MAG: hypothetical protein L0332_00430 [Chloroflexi bacterium]|nr:hypothetical protein [Chloroflexota bacterium]MCI0575980.1 hypothetical protein [Chloroflexota bacterium]MCI0648238.1 hypothetical protein [Chloroflexota bacterium]MCI0725190.1 hypothetical protein [Chloroflexota bacterium]
MSPQTASHGLNCPNCAAVVPVPEGTRIVTCPSCQTRSLVQGERGIRRWQVVNRLDRDRVLAAVRGFFSGMDKARDLKRVAQVRELFLVYLPYWRVQAFVAGWMFGRVRSGEDSTKPVEVEVMEEMHWNDAAADVSEFGVHQVSLSKDDLEPYDSERLHAEGMVFEPVESRDDALQEAEQHFLHRARSKQSLKQKFFEKFHMLRRQLSVVYYPLWVARYDYRGRNYQVVVDGVKGTLLYGKAPGNIFFRAAMLVLGMAAGNFILVNGTILAGLLFANSDDSDGWWIILFPLAIGAGLIIAGYSRFRYGEEVEKLQKEARKAALSDGGEAKNLLSSGLSIIEEISELDLSNLPRR